MIDFYISIGRERLSKIAELFAEDPYEYRKGWPDLTLWDPESGQIIFREIKAPGDKIRPSQKKMIEKILLPLGYNVGVVDVRRAAEAL
jgi:VRR-NUC domain